MADIVEVIARLGDSIVAIAHGPSVTIGEAGQVFAPMPTATVSIDTVRDHAISAGLVTIEIRRVEAPTDRVPRERPERRPAAYIAISMLVHVALWGTSMRASPGEPDLGAGRVAPMAWAPTRMASSVEVLDEGDPVPGVSMSLDDPRDGIGSSIDVAGNAGVALEEVPRARDEVDRRRAAIESARSAGILGSGALDGGLLGTGLPDLGDIYGSIRGDQRGEVTGAIAVDTSFASERRLRGGCIGDDCGPIGTGRYATVCGAATPNAPCTYGERSGYGVARSRVSAVPTIHMCGTPDGRAPSPCVAIVGELDKATIRRYLRRKLAAIIGCYEKQLLVSPQLTGAIDTEFIIDAAGHTRDITATGMDPEVASCVASVLGTIQFPRTKNGGITKVHYPFSFIVAGS